MRGNEVTQLEQLYNNSFVNRCATFIEQGKLKEFPKDEKKIWREFRNLTYLPAVFQRTAEEEKTIKKDAPVYDAIKSLFLELLTTYSKNNKYADNLSIILKMNSLRSYLTIYTLLDIGALAREIVKGQTQAVYLHPYCLENFLALEKEEYLNSYHLLKHNTPKDFYTKSKYMSMLDDTFTTLKDVHVFYRVVKTNISVQDETHVFFQLKQDKGNCFILASSMRERKNNIDTTLVQDCFIYKSPLKKKNLHLVPLIQEELKMVFRMAPIIDKYLRAKQFPAYNNGVVIMEGIHEIKKWIPESPYKQTELEFKLFENELTKAFFNIQ